MSYDEGLLAWVAEATEPLGTFSSRRMMGGATLYLDGVAFAIVGDDGLWLKADGETDAQWDAAGCERFTYTFPDGRVGSMNYRRAPDAVYDDGDELIAWARLALAAGVRAAAKKKPKVRNKPAI